MKTKIIVIAILIFLIPLAVFLFLKYSNKSSSGKAYVSPNTLYLTQPVMAFTGVVEKIEGNQLTVTQKQTLTTPSAVPPVPPVLDPATPSSPLPTPRTVTLTYLVTIGDQTQISQPIYPINYLFKTIPPQPPAQLTLQDIKVGQSITISSQVDLRTLKGNTFEASTLNLPSKINTLTGTITQLSSNALTLKAFAPGVLTNTASPVLEEREYTV
ncbi:MAG: hypothetical protein Q7T74_00380, partial [Candidatus Saccharibacteria bacterium]|nr:hypothetical protein [Candidatus Saccharibacteria bacterium]